jgi:cold shock CspA family protein
MQTTNVGTVKRILSSKYYGFIGRPGDLADIFFHLSAARGEHILSEGDRVAFDIESSPKGERAINVKLVSNG